MAVLIVSTLPLRVGPTIAVYLRCTSRRYATQTELIFILGLWKLDSEIVSPLLLHPAKESVAPQHWRSPLKARILPSALVMLKPWNRSQKRRADSTEWTFTRRRSTL